MWRQESAAIVSERAFSKVAIGDPAAGLSRTKKLALNNHLCSHLKNAAPHDKYLSKSQRRGDSTTRNLRFAFSVRPFRLQPHKSGTKERRLSAAGNRAF